MITPGALPGVSFGGGNPRKSRAKPGAPGLYHPCGAPCIRCQASPQYPVLRRVAAGLMDSFPARGLANYTILPILYRRIAAGLMDSFPARGLANYTIPSILYRWITAGLMESFPACVYPSFTRPVTSLAAQAPATSGRLSI